MFSLALHGLHHQIQDLLGEMWGEKIVRHYQVVNLIRRNTLNKLRSTCTKMPWGGIT